jgi:hypothetical protein
MKKNIGITHVCLVETVYSLMIYMLLVKEEDLKKTFFFVSESLPYSIIKKLSYSHCFHIPQKRYMKWLFRIQLYWTSMFRWPFIKHCRIYGSDNYLFSSGVVRENEMTLIEDGASNYSLLPSDRRVFFLKKFLMGNIAAYGCGGVSPNVYKICLTGLMPIPTAIKDKVEIISIENKWNSLTDSYKKLIQYLFDFSISDLDDIKSKKAVLFTQPMWEDGLIEKEEEISLYNQLLSDCDMENLVIKVHPRDTMDYSSLFPKAYIFTKKIPMELLSLFGVRFTDVYTVFSTAALVLPYKANIHFMGTTVHPNLLKMRGKIEFLER